MLDLSFVDGSTRGKVKGTTSARAPIGPVPSVLLEDRRSVHGRVSWKQIWAQITSGVLYGGKVELHGRLLSMDLVAWGMRSAFDTCRPDNHSHRREGSSHRSDGGTGQIVPTGEHRMTQGGRGTNCSVSQNLIELSETWIPGLRVWRS